MLEGNKWKSKEIDTLYDLIGNMVIDGVPLISVDNRKYGARNNQCWCRVSFADAVKRCD